MHSWCVCVTPWTTLAAITPQQQQVHVHFLCCPGNCNVSSCSLVPMWCVPPLASRTLHSTSPPTPNHATQPRTNTRPQHTTGSREPWDIARFGRTVAFFNEGLSSPGRALQTVLTAPLKALASLVSGGSGTVSDSWLDEKKYKKNNKKKVVLWSAACAACAHSTTESTS